jgi:hypothetical protein
LHRLGAPVPRGAGGVRCRALGSTRRDSRTESPPAPYCCQNCCHARGQLSTWNDRPGISAQKAAAPGRSWTTCLSLRIRRLGVRVPPSAPRSQAPTHSGEGPFSCLWEPCWEPPRPIQSQTALGSWTRRLRACSVIQVPVHVLRDRDAGMTQDLRHDAQRCALGEHQRGPGRRPGSHAASGGNYPEFSPQNGCHRSDIEGYVVISFLVGLCADDA